MDFMYRDPNQIASSNTRYLWNNITHGVLKLVNSRNREGSGVEAVKKSKGYFNLILHAHLPYVLSHGKWPHGMDWIFEAAAETYVPLIMMTRKLMARGIRPSFSIDISPVLGEQLADPEFTEGFRNYLKQKIEAAQVDAELFKKTGVESWKQALRWLSHYQTIRDQFENDLGGNVIDAFRELDTLGAIEIFTCGATHGYFPLLGRDWNVYGQVRTAVETHHRLFGRYPAGIWLPECAYRPSYKWIHPVGEFRENEPVLRAGVEEILDRCGLKYFIVDTHLLRGGKNLGVYISRFKALRQLWKQFESSYQPREEISDRSPYRIHWIGRTEDTVGDIAFFTRDSRTGEQVWSGNIGYPGDPRYLDFHKKNYPGGHRYWRVTGAGVDMGDKEAYLPDEAVDALEAHSTHFASLIAELLDQYRTETGEPGILSAPYDAELFGHWWFEGPGFLQKLFLKLDEIGITSITCADALETIGPRYAVNLPEGSWGQGGFHYIWLNKDTEWTWRKIYQQEYYFENVAARFHASPQPDPLIERLLCQALRELMLACASDWQFLISTISAADYAELRFSEHAKNCRKLLTLAERCLEGNRLMEEESEFLYYCEERDRLFSDVQLKWFSQEMPRIG